MFSAPELLCDITSFLTKLLSFKEYGFRQIQHGQSPDYTSQTFLDPTNACADQQQQTRLGKHTDPTKPDEVCVAVGRGLLVRPLKILSENVVLVSIYYIFCEHHESGHCSRGFQTRAGRVTPPMREASEICRVGKVVAFPGP